MGKTTGQGKRRFPPKKFTFQTPLLFFSPFSLFFLAFLSSSVFFALSISLLFPARYSFGRPTLEGRAKHSTGMTFLRFLQI